MQGIRPIETGAARSFFILGEIPLGVRWADPAVVSVRQFPATPGAPLWYNDRNQITAETERTR